MASAVSEAILQSEEIDRVVKILDIFATQTHIHTRLSSGKMRDLKKMHQNQIKMTQ